MQRRSRSNQRHALPDAGCDPPIRRSVRKRAAMFTNSITTRNAGDMGSNAIETSAAAVSIGNTTNHRRPSTASGWPRVIQRLLAERTGGSIDRREDVVEIQIRPRSIIERASASTYADASDMTFREHRKLPWVMFKDSEAARCRGVGQRRRRLSQSRTTPPPRSTEALLESPGHHADPRGLAGGG